MINIKKTLPLFNIHLIVNFLTYSFGTILIRGISFFILPLIMHKMPPSDYGILSLLTAFTTITTAIIGLGLRQLLSIEYFHAHEQQRRWLLQDILGIYTVLAVPAIILLWQLRSFIISLIFFNMISSFQLFGVLISIFFFFYSELMYQILQYEHAVKQLIFLQCSLATFIGISTVFTIFYLQIGITGIVWSQTIGTLIMAMIAFIFLRKKQVTLTNKRFMATSYYLSNGLPFIPGILASWILSSSDRWILGYFTTMSHVGIYAVADLASQLFYAIVLQSWAVSYLPYIMKQYHQEPHNLITIEKNNHRIMWITMIGLAIIITVGYPFAYIFISNIVPPSYLASLRYAWILLMGQLFLLGSYFTTALIQYTKHTYFLAAALCIPALLNIILNLIFIPYGGIMGCSLATLISYSMYFMVTYYYNKKLLTSH